MIIDSFFADLEAELFPPHCELGEGEYSYAQRNGTVLSDEHPAHHHYHIPSDKTLTTSSEGELSSLGSEVDSQEHKSSGTSGIGSDQSTEEKGEHFVFRLEPCFHAIAKNIF